jgi:hypothetical protein
MPGRPIVRDRKSPGQIFGNSASEGKRDAAGKKVVDQGFRDDCRIQPNKAARIA